MSTKPAEAAAAPPQEQEVVVDCAAAGAGRRAGGWGWFPATSASSGLRLLMTIRSRRQPRTRARPGHRFICRWTTWWSILPTRAASGWRRLASLSSCVMRPRPRRSNSFYRPFAVAYCCWSRRRRPKKCCNAEGKEKLANDILREAARPFGGMEGEEEAEPPKAGAAKSRKSSNKVRPGDLPVQRVLFSSFIVQ